MRAAAAEDREHTAATARRRGREECPRTVPEVTLADRLRHGPLASRGIEALDAVCREGALRGEVDNVVQVDFDPPDRPWEPPRRRDASLGGVAIPLRPDRGLGVAQVDRAHDAPALPATVGGLIGPDEWLGAGSRDTKPGALDVDAWRRKLAQEKLSFSSSATSFDTSR